MKKAILTATFAALACAVAVAGQTPAPPAQVGSPGSQAPSPGAPAPGAPQFPPTAQAPRAPEASSADSFTVIGCLQRRVASPSGTPGAVGTAGAVGGSSAGGSFILTSAMKPDGAAAGTPAASSAYRLDADDGKLASNVGQRVQITGTLAERSDKANGNNADAAPGAPVSPGAPGRPGSPGATGAAGSPASGSAEAPQLKVQTVKMISATCN